MLESLIFSQMVAFEKEFKMLTAKHLFLLNRLLFFYCFFILLGYQNN